MSQQVKRGVLLVLAAAAALAAGCGIPPTRVGFIETLAKENRKIARAAYAFRQTIKPLTEGKAASAASVRAAYQDLDKAVKEVRSDVSGQMLPPSSTSAKDLLEAYKTYLQGQDAMVQDEMLKIVQEVELPTDDNGNPTVEDRRAYIFGTAANNNQDGVLNQVGVKELDAYRKLDTAQKAYASEHNYALLSFTSYLAAQKSGK